MCFDLLNYFSNIAQYAYFDKISNLFKFSKICIECSYHNFWEIQN